MVLKERAMLDVIGEIEKDFDVIFLEDF